jgi:hypothetical protein
MVIVLGARWAAGMAAIAAPLSAIRLLAVRTTVVAIARIDISDSSYWNSLVRISSWAVNQLSSELRFLGFGAGASSPQ